MDILGNLSTLQATLAALATVVGIVFGFLRWVRPRVKQVGRDLRAGRDALVGREEIVDSITGRVLVPALPGMGVRMDTTEQNLERLTEAFSTLAKTHVQLSDHEDRLKKAEASIDQLKAAATERIVARAESAAAWHAVEAVAKATPPAEPEQESLPGVGEN